MDINNEIKLYDDIFRESLYKAHNGKCFYTGRKVNFNEMHVDHVLPLSCGGRDIISNLVLTSIEINERKSDAVDLLSVERMIYLNSILFCPKVVKYYKLLKKHREYDRFKKSINNKRMCIERNKNVALLDLKIDKNIVDDFNVFCKENAFSRISLIRIFIEEYIAN